MPHLVSRCHFRARLLYGQIYSFVLHPTLVTSVEVKVFVLFGYQHLEFSFLACSCTNFLVVRPYRYPSHCIFVQVNTGNFELKMVFIFVFVVNKVPLTFLSQ